MSDLQREIESTMQETSAALAQAECVLEASQRSMSRQRSGGTCISFGSPATGITSSASQNTPREWGSTSTVAVKVCLEKGGERTVHTVDLPKTIVSAAAVRLRLAAKLGVPAVGNATFYKAATRTWEELGAGVELPDAKAQVFCTAEGVAAEANTDARDALPPLLPEALPAPPGSSPAMAAVPSAHAPDSATVRGSGEAREASSETSSVGEVDVRIFCLNEVISQQNEVIRQLAASSGQAGTLESSECLPTLPCCMRVRNPRAGGATAFVYKRRYLSSQGKSVVLSCKNEERNKVALECVNPVRFGRLTCDGGPEYDMMFYMSDGVKTWVFLAHDERRFARWMLWADRRQIATPPCALDSFPAERSSNDTEYVPSPR